jgi:hypothetical protein
MPTRQARKMMLERFAQNEMVQCCAPPPWCLPISDQDIFDYVDCIDREGWWPRLEKRLVRYLSFGRLDGKRRKLVRRLAELVLAFYEARLA